MARRQSYQFDRHARVFEYMVSMEFQCRELMYHLDIMRSSRRIRSSVGMRRVGVCDRMTRLQLYTNEVLKNDLQTVETTSGLLATLSGSASDRVRKNLGWRQDCSRH
ncbi:hypothetical protein Tco_0506496 [Tanacetum coccineum]